MSFTQLMLRSATVAAALSTLLIACGDDDRRSAEEDAGGADAGGAELACIGNPTPCSTRTLEECVSGCDADACSGTPLPCSALTFRSECAVANGCRWISDTEGCQGAPASAPCGTYSSRSDCETLGCAWDPDAPCHGGARHCSLVDPSTCRSIPGCRLEGDPVDAGTSLDASMDGGRADAAAADGGRDAGSFCDPLEDTECGCAYSADSGTWECGVAGTAPVGASCGTTPCEAGAFCVGTYNGICRQLCRSNADCPTGTGCALLGEVGEELGACLPLDECAIADGLCSDSPEAYCYWWKESGQDYYLCNPQGNRLPNMVCTSPVECYDGNPCVDDGTGTRYCRTLCVIDTMCLGGTLCRGLTSDDDRYCE